MNNLETLKQELLNQKSALEGKGFSVSVANLNPSPSEITATLNQLPNLSLADATVTDVAEGKTFYSGNGELKTGEAVFGVVGGTIQDIEFSRLLQGQIAGTYSSGIPQGYTKIRAYCFSEGETSNLLTGDFVIPEGVTTICKNAFAYTNIETISLPETLTSIEAYAFSNCKMLKHLTIPNSMKELTGYIFQECNDLEYINLSNRLTKIMSSNFRLNNKLTTITFPSTLTTIASQNFVTNPELREIILLGDIVQFQSSTSLVTLHADCVIWCNFTAMETYANRTNWTKHTAKFISRYELAEGESFPTNTDTDLTYCWYTNESDAKARTNQITTPTGAGVYYVRFAV